MAVSKVTSARLHRQSFARPRVMGILNVTPDSFSDGGRYSDPVAAVSRAEQMAEEGADVIDVGGESTRPGAAAVPLEEELRRTIPVIRRLAKSVRVPLSIDTSKAEVAQRALDAGASIVNDVTALRGDPTMASVIASHKACVILMHMRGSPSTMQRLPRYRDLIGEIRQFLSCAIAQAVQAGVDRRRILVDPGLGFGKTAGHNLAIMRQLDRFVSLEAPVVIGASRKSFIGKTLAADIEDRLAGSLACAAMAWSSGIDMVRVHEVKPTVQFLTMLEAIRGADAPGREH